MQVNIPVLWSILIYDIGYKNDQSWTSGLLTGFCSSLRGNAYKTGYLAYSGHYTIEPQWPLFLKVNPPKKSLFQSKRGWFGFWVVKWPFISSRAFSSRSRSKRSASRSRCLSPSSCRKSWDFFSETKKAWTHRIQGTGIYIYIHINTYHEGLSFVW